MHPLYLDALSAHTAGYSKSFEKFNWPISEQIYDSVARAFIKTLETISTDSTLEESERFDLALSIVPIANESFYYASSHMILDTCHRLGQKYIFSPDCLYYNTISRYRTYPAKAIGSYLAEMKNERHRGFISKHISPRRKMLRRFRLLMNSKKKRQRVYKMTTNKLMEEWALPEEFASFADAPPPGQNHDPILKRGKIKVERSLKQAFQGADAVMTLRLQKERMRENLLTNLNQYHYDYGITHENLKWCEKKVPVLHPGPVNRGIEISSALLEDYSICLIRDQVENGIPIRMALLYLLATNH